MGGGAKGTEAYSDQRREFIIKTMLAMATAVLVAEPGAEPETVDSAVATFMRRVETDRLDTPVHLLALGGMLGRYVLSDESPRDTRALVEAHAGLHQAWWASGLDPRVLQGRA